MAIDTEVMIRMMIDITAGRPAPERETPEEAAMRARLTAEIDAMRSRDQIVDLPPEVEGP